MSCCGAAISNGMRFYLAVPIAILIFFSHFLTANASFGDVVITEIMYDLEGADTDREWVEIYNSGSDPVTLIAGSGNDGWRLYETHTSGSHNHTFATESYQGDLTLTPGEYAVIVQNGQAFKADHQNFAGTILVSSAFTLSNTNQSLGLKIGSGGALWSEVSYTNTLGANGNGKSLQKNGASWIAATPTPGAGFASGTSGGSSSESTSQSPVSNAGQASSSEGSALQPEAIIPRFRADAGKDQDGIVGAPVSFLGRVFGYTNEPLEGGRFLWSFGDGSSAEGRSVMHTYQFPGTYIAFVSVSSGYESASDYTRITIFPNSVFISELMSGPDGFFELANSGNRDVDIGSWALVNERSGRRFVMPERTIISAGSAVAFPTEQSFLEGGVQDVSLALVYSNNSAAFRVIVSEVLKPDESVGIRKDGTVYPQEKSSPGEFLKENKAPIVALNSPAAPKVIQKIFLAEPLSSEPVKEPEATSIVRAVPQQINQTGLVAASGIGWLGWASAISILGTLGFFFIRKIL